MRLLGRDRQTQSCQNKKEYVLPLEAEQIKADEGYMDVSYCDSEGYLTGGVGHLLTPEERKLYPEGTKIPKDVIEEWFVKDLQEAEADVNAIFGRIDNTELFGILLNMAFNLGRSRLSGFKKMIDAINKKEYNRAANEMLDSLWATQVKYRSKRLANRMRMLARYAR